jgi:hypothetical protein
LLAHIINESWTNSGSKILRARASGKGYDEYDVYGTQAISMRGLKVPDSLWRLDAKELTLYAELCGGDPWMIGGYLGGKNTFNDAIGAFAVAYAHRAERDHGARRFGRGRAMLCWTADISVAAEERHENRTHLV